MEDSMMYYKCLICSKILHGWGLPPHFSYKHPEIFKNMIRVQREKRGLFYRYHDYFSNGKLVAVCIGESKEYYIKRNLEMWIKELQSPSRLKKVAALVKEQKDLLKQYVKSKEIN